MAHLIDLIGQFRRDRRGGVALVLTLTLLPLLVMVGGAVDYSIAGRLKQQMQSSLDAAALAAGAQSAGRTAAQIEADARAVFFAQFRPAGMPAPTVNVTIGTSNLDMSATLNVPTAFLGIIGLRFIPIGAQAQTAWSMGRLRVALALDNTGSMASDGKMAALQTATRNLLTQLQNNSKSADDVYVSIVPFAKVVSVGTGYANAKWIRWTDANTCFFLMCSLDWDGAIQDRDQPHDISNAAPNGNSKLFPAIGAGSTGGTPRPIVPMTNNWGTLRATVAAMVPAGNTNQGIGLAWAWQTLTEGTPMNPPPMESGYAYQRVIILISDGLNTENRFTTVATTIDARQRQLCDRIKSDGVTIYTIQVNTTSDPRSAVLAYCASSPDKFVMMTNASQLDGVLAQIGDQLTRLRLAR